MAQYEYNNERFYVADNACLRVKEGKPLIVKKSQLNEEFNDMPYEIDTRLFMATTKTVKDIAVYSNYIRLLVANINSQCCYAGARGSFVAYLTAGYIPIWMPPTFMKADQYKDVVIQKLKEKNIRYRQEMPLRLNGSRVNSQLSDVWMSRIDIANILGKRVDKIVYIDAFKEVFS